MPNSYTKASYMKAMLEKLRDPGTITAEAEHRLDAYHDVRRFIHYINGRVFDVLTGRETKSDAYAAAYTWYPDDITEHFPMPEVDPKVSVRQLHEDMQKVETIRSLAGMSNSVDGLKWIDKATLRACTNIVKTDDDTIELQFEDRPAHKLTIVHSTYFANLCQDQSITAEKVIRFLKNDQFAVAAANFVRDLLPKLPPTELGGIIEYIESIKLHDDYQRKFNALLLRDILRRRYEEYQTGGPSQETAIEVPQEEHVLVRDFMIDMIGFLDSIRADDGGGAEAVATGNLPDGSPAALPAPSAKTGTKKKGGKKKKQDAAEEQTSLTVRNVDSPSNALPRPYNLNALQHADAASLAHQKSDLLGYIYSFVHRVPANRLAELGELFDRAGDILNRIPMVMSHEAEYRTSLYPLMTHTAAILRRMHNAIYLQQIMNGTLDFPDRTGNFDIDELMTHPWAFERETAFHLADQLHYSWRDGDHGGHELEMRQYLERATPAIRERFVALMIEQSQHIGDAGVRRLGYTP